MINTDGNVQSISLLEAGDQSTPQEQNPPQALTDDELKGYAEKLILTLKDSGGTVGNSRLIDKLGWSETLFLKVSAHLCEDLKITKPWRGPGGSLKLLNWPPLESADGISVQVGDISPSVVGRRESDFYARVVQAMEGFLKLKLYRQAVIDITAHQGARPTGKWTRPDITVGAEKAYEYVPAKKDYEVITYEVKLAEKLDVTAVYEALAHRRASMRSYVLVIIEGNLEQFDEVINDVCEEAERHGIGVVVTTDPGNWQDWSERVEAIRHEPDSQKLNDFIAEQPSDRFRREWLRLIG